MYSFALQFVFIFFNLALPSLSNRVQCHNICAMCPNELAPNCRGACKVTNYCQSIATSIYNTDSVITSTALAETVSASLHTSIAHVLIRYKRSCNSRGSPLNFSLPLRARQDYILVNYSKQSITDIRKVY